MSAVSERFSQCCARYGTEPAERSITVGGVGLHLHFSDQLLAETTKISLNFPAVGSDWDLYIYRDQFPKAVRNREENSYLFHRDDERIFGTFGFDTVFEVDFAAKEGYVCFDADKPVPFEFQCHPLRILLHYIMRVSGKLLLHSAAVGLGDTGVMLSSCGGRGKSTLALSSLIYGLDYLGDDYIILSRNSHRAEMLYTSGYLTPVSLQMMPTLKPYACAKDSSRDDKTLLDLSDFKNSFSTGFTVGAIVFPQISESNQPAIKSVSAQIPTAHLAVSTAAQMPDPDKNEFIAAVMGAIKGIPTYQITLTRNLEANSAVLAQLIKKLKEEKNK
ncbi:MAG TPA: hypothetical protein PK854_06470 [Oscillospiraceae bacterium]|nr:hypothetical protein [Oscillospiraceae bacterium]HPS34890.1 hypothetical protein [Oscillospiraceae bacterium]